MRATKGKRERKKRPVLCHIFTSLSSGGGREPRKGHGRADRCVAMEEKKKGGGKGPSTILSFLGQKGGM